MNVSLQGARSQARLDWDVLENRRRASTAQSAGIFLVVVVAFAAFMLWKYAGG